MVDHIVDTSERRGVDIRVGVGRRRRWRSADKGRIVRNPTHRERSYRKSPVGMTSRRSICLPGVRLRGLVA